MTVSVLFNFVKYKADYSFKFITGYIKNV